MILNYIWISLILLAVIMGLVQALCFGNVEIFSDILNSTFDNAKTGFELSLGLTGVLALWMGIMKIGERAGAVNSLGRIINPFFSRIFPEIPKGHPVFGTMLMNVSANMLGLDNAATPMGLKAMSELQELNTDKTKASNAMIMFVVLGASGLTLIPTTIMAYRAELGAANPADVFLPILIATYVATLVGLLGVCIARKIRLKDPVVLGTIIGLTALVGLLVWGASCMAPKTLSVVSAAAAAIILLGVICWFIIQAMVHKINVYDAFIDGAKDGFKTAIGIVPFLIAILVAVGMFRASGAMGLLEHGIAVLFGWCGINNGDAIDVTDEDGTYYDHQYTEGTHVWGIWNGSIPEIELSQTLKNLPKGAYTLKADVMVQNQWAGNCLTTQRIFANDYVQMWGYDGYYEMNMPADALNAKALTYAGYSCDKVDGLMDNQQPTSLLRPMEVHFDVLDDGVAVIGFRTNGINPDGTPSDNGHGWFKLDNFRLSYDSEELLSVDGIEQQKSATTAFYSLDGRRLQAPQRGINIMKTADKTVKVMVK